VNLSASTLRDRGVRCVSDLQLDQLLASDLGGPSENHVRHHLEECNRCRARLTSFQGVAPVAPSAAALGRQRGSARRLVLGGIAAVAALAATAGLALFLAGRVSGTRHRDPGAAPPAGAATGGRVGLDIQIRRRSGAIARLDPTGEAVRPGEELRFAVSASSPGYAVVLGLDVFPSVTLYVPADAADPAIHIEAPGDKLLLGAVVADETLGQERIFAVVCPTAVAPADVRERARVALAATHGRPEEVASLGTGCQEASVLFRKEFP
jgi:hypothetical protein